jgi:lipoyl(octanoyl) transferase
MGTPVCDVQRLGLVPYARALALQAELVELRGANRIADRLLLLEHPHVITIGRDGRAENILADPARLAALGTEVFACGRGGDVTYHGPGQLVAYPILDLRPDRCDLHRYVRDLEQVMLQVLARYGVAGHVVPGRTGVWVRRAGLPEAKIGAIGVRVARWITSHGIALNVRTELGYFELIVPCGLAGSAVTSLAELVQPPPTTAEVADRFASEFGAVFGRRMRALPAPALPEPAAMSLAAIPDREP